MLISACFLVAIVVASPSPAQTSPSPSTIPAMLPGQVLVKFTLGSRLEEAFRTAAKDPSQNGKLEAQIAEALAPLAVPLAAKLVTSGSELLLVLDQERFARQICTQLGTLADVTRVEFLPPERRVLPPAQLDFAVHSRERPSDPLAAAQRLKVAATQSLGVPLEVKPAEGGATILSVDLRALTLRLIEKLRGLPGVEYAQANVPVQKF